MGSHLINGEFQSDKYPETPRGLVPLKPTDPTAQDLLWEYAQRRRKIDAEFASDLEEALIQAGYDAKAEVEDVEGKSLEERFVDSFRWFQHELNGALMTIYRVARESKERSVFAPLRAARKRIDDTRKGNFSDLDLQMYRKYKLNKKLD